MTASEIETDLKAFGNTPAPHGANVFYGSSSIRMWDNLAQCFPGLPVVNRGFGGSTLAECIGLLPRLIEPLRPATLILYAADNDLEEGASPEHVVYLFRQFIAWVRNHFPTVPIAFLSVKPSPARFWNISKIRRANELIQSASGELPDVSFLNLYPQMLSPSGGPRPELFTEDGLHMNRAGYDLWTTHIRELARRPPTMIERAYHKWRSPFLDREMDMLVFGHGGQRLLVFPTRKQRFFEYEDHGMIHSLRHRIEAGEIQVFCVDSIDAESLYCFDISPEERLKRHLQYERYIVEEVVPFTETQKHWTALIAHGCSFGAFHAVSMTMRHPHIFHGALAFSGRYDLTLHAGDFHSLFHGYFSDDLKSIMPSLMIPEIKDRKYLRDLRNIHFTLVIGEEDPFYPDNERLVAAMAAKKLPHSFKIWCGDVHRFRYWRQMIRIYL